MRLIAFSLLAISVQCISVHQTVYADALKERETALAHKMAATQHVSFYLGNFKHVRDTLFFGESGIKISAEKWLVDSQIWLGKWDGFLKGDSLSNVSSVAELESKLQFTLETLSQDWTKLEQQHQQLQSKLLRLQRQIAEVSAPQVPTSMEGHETVLALVTSVQKIDTRLKELKSRISQTHGLLYKVIQPSRKALTAILKKHLVHNQRVSVDEAVERSQRLLTLQQKYMNLSSEILAKDAQLQDAILELRITSAKSIAESLQTLCGAATASLKSESTSSYQGFLLRRTEKLCNAPTPVERVSEATADFSLPEIAYRSAKSRMARILQACHANPAHPAYKCEGAFLLQLPSREKFLALKEDSLFQFEKAIDALELQRELTK